MAEKKNLVIGTVAHVDAGKTTLSEALLYNSGAIDRLGRVDKKDAFLDTYSLERERGTDGMGTPEQPSRQAISRE